MEYYPQNTAAQYTTKLVHTIELEGDWEVGLTEICVPGSIENVISEGCYYNLYLNNIFVRKIVLESGHYRRINRLLEELNNALRLQVPLQDSEESYVRFSYHNGRKRTIMRITEVPSNVEISVEFSQDLARLLGFESDRRYTGVATITAESVVNLKANIRSLYIYCDLLESVIVGDTKAPLLRIVDTTRNVHHTLYPVQYVPLQKRTFDTVEINVMTDTGQPVPFRPGKTFAVLEFRRVVHPYFAI